MPAMKELVERVSETTERIKTAIQSEMTSEVVAEIESVARQKAQLLEDVGTTNEQTLAKLMSLTDSYQTLCRNDQVIIADVRGAVGNLVSFADNIVEAVERPLRTSELPAISHADMLFEYYQRTQGLPIKLPLRSFENMQVVLWHMARQLPDLDKESAKFHISCIVTEFSGEDLCKAAMSEPHEKKLLNERLKSKLVGSKPELHRLRKKVQEAEEKRKRIQQKKDALEEKKEKLLDVDEELSADEIEELDDKIQDLKDSVVERKEEKRDAEMVLEDALHDHEGAFALLNNALDEFRTALQGQLGEIKVKFLIMHIASIVKSVMQPIQNIATMAEDCQQALYNDRAFQCTSEAPEGSGTSSGRRALANWRESSDP
jgi:chromosome segregation ATPase